MGIKKMKKKPNITEKITSNRLKVIALYKQSAPQKLKENANIEYGSIEKMWEHIKSSMEEAANKLRGKRMIDIDVNSQNKQYPIVHSRNKITN